MPDWEAVEKAKMQEQSKTPGPEKAVHTDSLVDSSANSQKIQSLQESGGPQTDSSVHGAGGGPATQTAQPSTVQSEEPATQTAQPSTVQSGGPATQTAQPSTLQGGGPATQTAQPGPGKSEGPTAQPGPGKSEGPAKQTDLNEGEGEQEVQELVNEDLKKVVEAAEIDPKESKEKETDNRKFDTLSDLKDLGQVPEEKDEKDTEKKDSKNLKEARENVHKLRKGNLYKAVIIARILAPGDLSAEKALKDQKKAAEKSEDSSGRYARFLKEHPFANSFLNSSEFEKGLDRAGKATKTTGAINGIVATANKDYGKTKLFAFLSLSSDVTTLVGSLRGIIKKIIAYRKDAEIGEKALALAGMASDCLMIISKVASIIKTIGDVSNMPESAKNVFRRISSYATLASQAAGIPGTCAAIGKIYRRKKELERDQSEEEKKVRNIIGDGAAPDEKDSKGGNKAASETKDSKGGNKAASEVKDSKGKNKVDDKEVIRALTERNLTDDEKAILASYLARKKVINKKRIALFNTSIGLASTFLGMGAVLGKEISAETNPADGSKSNEKTKQGGEITAYVGNAAGIVSSGIMPLIAEGRDMMAKEGEEPGLIKEGLWGALTNLGKAEDKYGLRGIANGLTKKESEQEYIAKATVAVEQYGKVEKQLDGADVDYRKLFAAENQEKFKDALVAGI